jgi:hypothetical protein
MVCFQPREPTPAQLTPLRQIYRTCAGSLLKLARKERRALTRGMQYGMAEQQADGLGAEHFQFYNLVLFMSSVAIFSLVAQRVSGGRAGLQT